MMTIYIRKREKDEKFTYKDILKEMKIIHEDCYGGEVKFEREKFEESETWIFTCLRCGVKHTTKAWPTLKIVRAAIDGEEITINDRFRIQVVQK